MSEADPILSVRGLDVALGPTPSAPVLRAFDLEVRAGEVLCLFGASGAGKSVAARVMMRLDRFEPGGITAGQINLDGLDLTRLGAGELRRLRGSDVAMIFQEPAAALNPVRRIGAQLAEALPAMSDRTASVAMAEARALLRRVRFDDPGAVLRSYPHQLSGGMCQRVMIAMALAGAPKILIADEPTTALDAVTQAEVLDLLDSLRRETGMAIVLITHDRAVVARMAHRVAVMDGGRVVEAGPRDAMLEAPQSDVARALLAAPPVATYRTRPARAAPVLELRNVTVSPYDRRDQPVVREVSLSIGRGETVALVGGSGSGKTTLARAALRLLPLASGQVLLGGEDITRARGRALRSRRARMQMVFQDPLSSLDPRRTLAAQVEDPMRNFGIPGAERRDRVTALFDRVGLPRALMARLPAAASGGQRQRAAIARALATEPEVIVADEALASLDVHIRGRIIDLLIDLQRERGLACLFISHDIASVARIAHRIAVLHDGRIVEEGPAQAVMETPGHVYTRRLIAAAGGAALPEDAYDLDELRDVGGGHFVMGGESD